MEETTKESELSESMECLSVENKIEPPKRYSMRRRIPRAPKEPEVRNRRCNMRPKKRSYSTMENDDEIREYYLDKSIKKKNPVTTLETIYEEIDGMNENSKIVNGRKLKRLIQFSGKISDAKLKKRKAKVKRLFDSKIQLKSSNNNKMPALLKKLNSIITESSSSTKP